MIIDTITFTASQAAVIGVICLTIGVLAGVWITLHVVGGLIIGKKS